MKGFANDDGGKSKKSRALCIGEPLPVGFEKYLAEVSLKTKMYRWEWIEERGGSIRKQMESYYFLLNLN